MVNHVAAGGDQPFFHAALRADIMHLEARRKVGQKREIGSDVTCRAAAREYYLFH